MSIDINEILLLHFCTFIQVFAKSCVKDKVEEYATSIQLVNGPFTAHALLELLLPSLITVVSTTGAM